MLAFRLVFGYTDRENNAFCYLVVPERFGAPAMQCAERTQSNMRLFIAIPLPPTAEGWKKGARYELLTQQFHYGSPIIYERFGDFTRP